MSDKYHDAINASRVLEDDLEVSAKIAEILEKHYNENYNEEVFKFLFNTIDLTTLSSEDSYQSVAQFTERVNAFDAEYPMLKNVAAICVYPNFAGTVRSVLEVNDVDIACVSGAFPSSQTFDEVKIAETSLAVQAGADEIDIVLNIGNFLEGDYEAVCDEIAEQKEACRDGRLKVILETGCLKTAKRIKEASILSMYSGADFIKTSTGKIYPGASLEAAYVMALAIREYYEKTGRMVGFKAAGGVSTTEDAVKYYSIIKEVLGEKWLTNEYFRLGASRLANKLLSSILGKEVKFF